MGIKRKARRARAGDERTKITHSECTNIAARNQDYYSNPAAEALLIGAALLSGDAVVSIVNKVDRKHFSNPSLWEIWEAVASNPTAGTAAIPRGKQALAVTCLEKYNGEDPLTLFEQLEEACQRRTLQDVGAYLLCAGANSQTPSTSWIEAKRLVEDAGVAPYRAKIERWNPDTLAAANFPECRFLIPTLLPEGITLLAGRPKTGKSWLGLEWASRIEGGCIYLAYEDNPRRLRERTRTLGIKGPNPVLLSAPPWRMPEALGALSMEVDDVKPAAVIVDPWAYFAPASRDNRRIYNTDYDALAQLRRWAEDECVSVVIIHHSRKPAPGQRSDFLDEPLGSTALTGAVDTVAVLKRKNDKEAVLHVRGRDVQEMELALTFDAGIWKILGETRNVIPTGARAGVIAVLMNANAPLKPSEVAKVLDEPRDNVKVVLGRMYHDGQVARDEKGRYTPVTAVTAADF